MEKVQDKINRNVAHGVEDMGGTSPMDPPSPYDLHESAKDDLSFDELAPVLQSLYQEHEKCKAVLDRFEKGLISFRENDWQITPENSETFKEFFHFIDEKAVVHNLKEEKALFPILHERLIEVGECSPGLNATTPVDVLEDEHIKMMQLSCLVFNLLGLGAKINDQESRVLVFQHAMEQGRELVELMRLHIFREDKVLFPLAMKHLKVNEFENIETKMKRFL